MKTLAIALLTAIILAGCNGPSTDKVLRVPLAAPTQGTASNTIVNIPNDSNDQRNDAPCANVGFDGNKCGMMKPATAVQTTFPPLGTPLTGNAATALPKPEFVINAVDPLQGALAAARAARPVPATVALLQATRLEQVAELIRRNADESPPRTASISPF